jgi:hypothetical protein
MSQEPVTDAIPESDTKPRRSWRSILAWWGFIPVIAFFAMEVVYGWPRAVIRATSPELATSYFVGHVLGALLISYVIAWIAYRVARRSRLVGTIAFSAIMALACVSLLPRLTSFGDFRFELPTGWVQGKPERPKTKALLAMIPRGAKSPDGLLMVDVGKAAAPSAMDLAKSLAGRDGRVLPEPVAVDQEEGVRVEMPSVDLSRPRCAVVVFRNGKAYLIMAAAMKGTDITDAFEEVLKTWKWNAN